MARLTILDERDLRMCELIMLNDPFQFADLPLRQVWNKLPPETINTLQGEHKMPIKLIAAEEAPARLQVRSGLSMTQDYREVMNAINQGALKNGKAIVVELADETKSKFKKPDKSPTLFAAQLRRYFASNGVMATAYASGVNMVTVKAEKITVTPKKK